ncbi:unnamed protein product [Moneuplotes crassus]|uniref:Uncharacterized protein n=1 Tax=Euplotes crassus TaxID=5936 RepID=A0AAD1UDV7_EUPCR|nr:unnamed protein product [Moneuplotes crassus]
MSIYSGFGTRQQEESYNKNLYHIIFLLQLKITKEFMSQSIGDEKFEKVFKKLYMRLSANDNSKYLPPRFSYAMKDLAEYYGVFVDLEGNKTGQQYLASNASNSSLSTVAQLKAMQSGKKSKMKSSKKRINIQKPNLSNFKNEDSFNLEIIKETVKNKISANKKISKKKNSIETGYRLAHRRQTQKNLAKPSKAKRNSLAPHHAAKKTQKSRIEKADGVYTQNIYERLEHNDALNLSCHPRQYARNNLHFTALNSSFDMPLDHQEAPPLNISELDLDSNSLESEGRSHSKASKYPQIADSYYRKHNSMQKNYHTDSKTKAKLKYQLNRSHANSPSSLNPNMNIRMDSVDNNSSTIYNQNSEKRKLRKIKHSPLINHQFQQRVSEKDTSTPNGLPSVTVNFKIEPGTGSAMFDANYEPSHPDLQGYESEEIDGYASDHFEG